MKETLLTVMHIYINKNFCENLLKSSCYNKIFDLKLKYTLFNKNEHNIQHITLQK